jgi:hypothetical protein
MTRSLTRPPSKKPRRERNSTLSAGSPDLRGRLTSRARGLAYHSSAASTNLAGYAPGGRTPRRWPLLERGLEARSDLVGDGQNKAEEATGSFVTNGQNKAEESPSAQRAK